MTKIMQDPLPTKCVHNLIIVDESGSMEVIRKQAFTLIGTDNLDVETIRPYVDEFIQFAKEHQDLTFLVTRIGCGIAGFTDDEISPLFEKAHDAENIVLPPGW